MRRRTFLFGGAAVAGGLVLGYNAWSRSFVRHAAELLDAPGRHLLAGWVTIGTDDTVTVQVPHIDMGQGVHTTLAMMLADELDADWSTVRAERAPAQKAFANRFLARGWIMRNRSLPGFADGLADMGFAEAARLVNLQITGGSTAVRFTGEVGMRTVGAAARMMLVEAAARRWGVRASRLEVSGGQFPIPQAAMPPGSVNWLARLRSCQSQPTHRSNALHNGT